MKLLSNISTIQYIESAIQIRPKKKKKKKRKDNCMSQSCRARLFFGWGLIQQNTSFQFLFLFLCLFFIFYFFIFIFFFAYFFPVFMNLLVKVYMKRHDRHDKTLKTTHFFNSVFCLVSCSSKNQVPYFILNKVVTDSNLKRLLLWKKKQTNKQNKKEKEKEKPTFRSGLPGFSRDIDFFFL